MDTKAAMDNFFQSRQFLSQQKGNSIDSKPGGVFTALMFNAVNQAVVNIIEGGSNFCTEEQEDLSRLHEEHDISFENETTGYVGIRPAQKTASAPTN